MGRDFGERLIADWRPDPGGDETARRVGAFDPGPDWGGVRYLQPELKGCFAVMRSATAFNSSGCVPLVREPLARSSICPPLWRPGVPEAGNVASPCGAKSAMNVASWLASQGRLGLSTMPSGQCLPALGVDLALGARKLWEFERARFRAAATG